MTINTVLCLTAAVAIISGFAMLAYVTHLADIAKKERRQRKRAIHHPA